MASFTSDELATLKQRYETAEAKAWAATPTAGMCQKKDIGGSGVRISAAIAAGPSVGARLDTTLANALAPSRLAFTVAPQSFYVQTLISNFGALFSEGSDNAVVSTFEDAIDLTMSLAGQMMERICQGDGSGTDGIIQATTGTTGACTFTLRPGEAYKFQFNQILATKLTPFAASLDTGTFQVTGVDPIANIISVNAAGGANASTLVGHYVGFANSVAASTLPVLPVGIPFGWLDNTAANLAASFFGVVRNVSKVNLAGSVIDCTGFNSLQAIQVVLTAMGNLTGAKADVIIVSPGKYNKLMALTSDQRRFADLEGPEIGVNYAGFKFHAGAGGAGMVTVMQSVYCPDTVIEVLDSSTWVIASPGKKPVQSAFQGELPYLNNTNTDDAIIRIRGAFAFYCTNPGFNGMAINVA